QAPEALSGCARKTKSNRLPPRGRNRLAWRYAQHLGSPGVSDDEPAVCRQHLMRKVRWNSEEEPFAPFQILGPFPVGAKVGEAGLDLDRQQLAISPQRHHVDPSATGQGEFGKAGIA